MKSRATSGFAGTGEMSRHGVWVYRFLLHQSRALKNDPEMLSQPGKANIGGERNCHSFRGPFRVVRSPS